MGEMKCHRGYMSGHLKIMVLEFVLFVGRNLGKSKKRSPTSSEEGSAVHDNVMLGYQLLIVLARKLIITSRLKGFADIVARSEWLLLHILRDLTVIADVWQWITGIGNVKKIIGTGREVLLKSNAVIVCMRGIRHGGSRYLEGMVMPVENVEQIKAGY